MKKYNVYRMIPAEKLDNIEDSYNLEVLQYDNSFNTEEEAIKYIEKLKKTNDSDLKSEFTILPIY